MASQLWWEQKSKVRFANDRIIWAEGIGDAVIKRNGYKNALITDVLFVGMRNNLISMGCVLKKGFTMSLCQGNLEGYDSQQIKENS